jgi:hypothetical protein
VPGFELPRTLTLPSGRRVQVRLRPVPAPREEARAGLFAEALRVLEEEVVIVAAGKEEVDPRDLPLSDFHLLRAVVTKAGLLPEAEVEITCSNCDALLAARPCARLEVGPWEDGEIDDPELDRTLPFGEAVAIEPFPIGRVREARDVVLAPRTVREAAPLHEALARGDPPSRVGWDGAIVTALGIVRLGALEDPGRIARALADADPDARAIVTDVFLAAHYPARLACDLFCPSCKARNVVDAPYDRELEPGEVVRPEPGGDAELSRVPPLERFVENVHAIGDPLLAELPGERPDLVVEDGPPAVDDGGEPLLGAYEPPPPEGAPVPTRPPTVRIYYRTFVREEEEGGLYDWEGELRETIEHELEHHVSFLRGADPMDDEERAEINREALRVLGEKEVGRRNVAGVVVGIGDFLRRGWPLILLAALALVVSIAESRCADP